MRKYIRVISITARSSSFNLRNDYSNMKHSFKMFETYVKKDAIIIIFMVSTAF